VSDLEIRAADVVGLAEPGRVIAASLRVRRRRLLRLLALSLLLGSPGVLDGGILLLLCSAFFGLCAVVFLILLLPGAAYLRLEPHGFTVCSLFRKHFTAWSDVTEFGVATAGRQELVGYDSRATAERSPRLAALSIGLSGYNSALPDTYGPRAADLASLLNAVLKRAHAAAGVDATETATRFEALGDGRSSANTRRRLSRSG
jgi:hypothetical protein